MILLAIDTGPFFQVDMSINLTTIIGIVVWVITLTVAWTKFGGRMDMLEYRVSNLETAVTKIANAMERFADNGTELKLLKQELAAIQTNFTMLNQTVEDLRRGRAWVQKDLDREYPPRTS